MKRDKFSSERVSEKRCSNSKKTWGMKQLYFSSSPVIFLLGSPTGWLTPAHKLHSTAYNHWTERNCTQLNSLSPAIHAWPQHTAVIHCHVETHLHALLTMFSMPIKECLTIHSVIDLWPYTCFGVEWITLCVIDVGEFLVASHELISAALSGQVAFFKHLLELWNRNQSIQQLRHRLTPSTTETQTHAQVQGSFIERKKIVLNIMKIIQKRKLVVKTNLQRQLQKR